MSLNKIFLEGRLGQDPELKYTANQKPVVSMSVATSKKFKDKPEKVTWHKVLVYGNNAENCKKYLKKGSRVLVEGEMDNGSFDGKDGNKVYFSHVVSFHVSFLDEKKSEEKYMDAVEPMDANEILF